MPESCGKAHVFCGKLWKLQKATENYRKLEKARKSYEKKINYFSGCGCLKASHKLGVSTTQADLIFFCILSGPGLLRKAGKSKNSYHKLENLKTT